MKLSFVEPDAELKPYIQSIWVFESLIGMPRSEMSLAAPNGCSKIIITCENAINSTVNEQTHESSEHGIYFIGTRDISVQVSASQRKTTFIGIEFYPHGAYPIFGIPMAETTNRLLHFEEILSTRGKSMNGTLSNLENINDKLNFIQDQLKELLRKRQLANPVIKYCVNTLKITNGLITVSDLERKTGYTRRYLEMLFKDHVGFSPKVLAGIFRFQKFYKKWARGFGYDQVKDELYDYYYDQAHFAKEFKSMTGFSPKQFTSNVSNEFGRRLSLY